MRFAGILLFVLTCTPAASPAREEGPAPVPSAREVVQELRGIFAPDRLPEALRTPGSPEKCATACVRRYEAGRASLPPRVRALADGWLRDAEVDGVLETAHFRVAWSSEGPDAIPAADIAPADGIPDHVARVAAWGETAWSVLVDGAGFPPPLVSGGRVDVSFRGMAAYGYTRLVQGVPSIVLHKDFAGFPPNDDPEGPAAGAAKVTIAHELKHALQYAASGWTEGGWLEADAVWAEDFVFDETDDYLRFLGDGSPVSDPADWFPVSYEDCLFPRLLAERHGTDVLVRFFERRAAARDEPVLASFDAALRDRGSSLADATATLGLWTWFCGANAPGRPEGFEEAMRYPTPPIAAHVEGTSAGTLAGLGTHHLLATAFGRSGTPRVAFSADRGSAFSVWAVTLDRTGRRACVAVTVDDPASATIAIDADWESLATLALVVTHVDAGAPAAGYGIRVNDDAPVAADAPARSGRFELRPGRPNPFRDRTTIGFFLPAPSPVHAAVFDVAGRRVRTLEPGTLREAGGNAVSWDGRDDAGSPAAPGLYAVRVTAGPTSGSCKVLLVR